MCGLLAKSSWNKQSQITGGITNKNQSPSEFLLLFLSFVNVRERLSNNEQAVFELFSNGPRGGTLISKIFITLAHLRTTFTDYDATCAHEIRKESRFSRDLVPPRHKMQFSVIFYGIIKCTLRPKDLISLVKDRSIKDANL